MKKRLTITTDKPSWSIRRLAIGTLWLLVSSLFIPKKELFEKTWKLPDIEEVK